VKETVAVTVTVMSMSPAHRCFGQAGTSGALRVSLQTEPDNTVALALYTAAGSSRSKG
jgi:hypothetical protein